jgi:tetratricopeptide (TPR) repeat protein
MEMLSLRPSTGDDAAELARLVESRLPDFPNWRFAPLGAALYRNGRYDEALRVLNEYLNGHDSLQRDARAWPLLAMTHWQLGHHDEARRWLNRSAWWIDQFRRAADAPATTGFHDADCRDWLYTNVFFAEAKALIDGDSSSATPMKDRRDD